MKQRTIKTHPFYTRASGGGIINPRHIALARSWDSQAHAVHGGNHSSLSANAHKPVKLQIDQLAQLVYEHSHLMSRIENAKAAGSIPTVRLVRGFFGLSYLGT